MQEPVDRDSSGVNLEQFLVRNRFRNTRVLIATARLAFLSAFTTWPHSLHLNRE
ncbi:MAG: hypothetical protein QXV84_01585 [Conexivisphaerales archaeon]